MLRFEAPAVVVIQRSESVSIDFPLANITCPIANEIFFDPKMAVPCGHMFEQDEIHTWMESRPTCPCCRGKIEKLIDAPPVFHELLENALTRYPQLQEQRYFSLGILAKSLAAKDNTKLEKIIKFLTIVDEHINILAEDGDSVIKLLLQYDMGVMILDKNDEFRAKINSDSLNSSYNVGNGNGTTALTLLVADVAGRRILRKDDVLRAKITAFGLNNIISGSVDKGTCALNWLLKTKIGIEIICQDEVFRAKVTEEGLNSIQLDKREKIDRDAGTSAVFFLVKAQDGLELLFKDDVLRSKINARGMNAVCEDKEFFGQSAVYLLAETQRGRELLCKDARMRKLIDPQKLHIKVQASGKSAADWLQETDDGRELLQELDPKFTAKMTNEKYVPVNSSSRSTVLFHHHKHQHCEHENKVRNTEGNKAVSCKVT